MPFNCNMKKLFLLVVILINLVACGKQNLDANSGITLNSMFLNLQNGLNYPVGTTTQTLFEQDTNDFNLRLQDNVLFRPPYRPTVMVYGDLDPGVLGLTACEYHSDGYSQCTITISNLINPDTAPTLAIQNARTNAFVGVIRHELGHAFGLGHIKDNPQHVMYPYFNDIQLQEVNVAKFFLDLDNFRRNGSASGLPSIQVK